MPTLSTTQVGAVAEWRYTASDIQAQSMSISPANLMMFKSFNPLCRYRGLSPLNPAAFAIDQLNEYNRTNYSLLKNGMQPSGSLTTEGNIDEDKFERLKEQFSDTYTGSGNNGKPIILEGGLKIGSHSVLICVMQSFWVVKLKQKRYMRSFRRTNTANRY